MNPRVIALDRSEEETSIVESAVVTVVPSVPVASLPLLGGCFTRFDIAANWIVPAFQWKA